MNPFDLDSIIEQKLNNERVRIQSDIRAGGKQSYANNKVKKSVKKEPPPPKKKSDVFSQRYEEVSIDAVKIDDYLRFSTEERNGEPTIGGILKKIVENPDGTKTLSIRVKRGPSYTWLNYNSRGIKKVYRFLKNETEVAVINNDKKIEPEEKTKIEKIGDHLLFGDLSDINKKHIDDLTARVQALETELANLKTNLKTLFPLIKRGAEAYDALRGKPATQG